jgi:Raf kinase inhibitor-like YbhB/YbcL family protein
MNFGKWTILIVVIMLIAIFFSRVLIVKKVIDFKNLNNKETNMKIESNIFKNNGDIPAEYTCSGKSTRVPISISGVPKEAKSLAIIVDDPDAPSGDFVHWVLWNIPADTSMIESDSIPNGAQEGANGTGKPGWVAPCPPSGTHHYFFRLYALDINLSIEKPSTKSDLILAMGGHIIEEATLVGLYGKK